jgi:hypothetical protein
LDSLGGDLASFEISSKLNNIKMVNFQKFSKAFLRAKTTCHNDDFNLKVVALDPIYHMVCSLFEELP